MTNLTPAIVDGLFSGVSLAALSAGLALVMNVIKVINLSHGAFFLLGTYLAYSSAALFPGGSVLITPVAFLGPALIGFFIGKSVVNPLRKDSFAIAVSTLAVAILFEQIALIVWGARALSISQGKALFKGGDIFIFPWHVKETLFLIITALFFLVLQKTRLGLAMKITAEDEEMARSVGVDTDFIRALAFSISCGIASLAGYMIAPSISLSPTGGRMPLVLSLIIVIISGHERLLPVCATGIIFGVITSLIATFFPSYLAYGGLLLCTLILLVVKPAGIFGFSLEREM